jgi:hypothetical protein
MLLTDIVISVIALVFLLIGIWSWWCTRTKDDYDPTCVNCQMLLDHDHDADDVATLLGHMNEDGEWIDE